MTSIRYRTRGYWLALVVVLAVAAGAQAQQYARPTQTFSSGAWTPFNAGALHDAVREENANDDNDYMTTTGNNTTAELGLSSVSDPGVTTGHIIRFRMESFGAGAKERCEVQLYQGGNFIATTSAQQSRDAYATFTYTLTTVEAGNITPGYADLRFQVVSSSVDAGEEVRVTWMELEVPGQAGFPPTIAATPDIQAVQDTVADLGGNVTDIGTTDVTERGVYWSTTQGFTPPGEGAKVWTTGTWSVPFNFFETVTLPQSELVYFQAFATNSFGDDFSNERALQTEPTAQAASITFSSVTHNSMTVNWTVSDPANVDGSIVVARAANSIPAGSLPVDGTEHDDGSGSFAAGNDLGSSSFVVYRGTATSAPVTNLQPNTTYFVKVFTYAGAGTDPFAGINYQQDGPEEQSQGTGPPPPTVANPSIADVEDTTATLGGQVTDTGNGAEVTERGVYWSTTQGFTAPGGTRVATADSQIVPFTFTQAVDNLPESSLVYFQAFAKNAQGEGYSSEAALQTEPTTQVSNITFPAVNSGDMTIGWTGGSGDGVIVIIRQGAAVSALPTDGTPHAFNLAFGDVLTDLGGGNYVVYRGAAVEITVTNLLPQTQYFVKVFEYAGSGTGDTGINYQQDAAPEDNRTTPAQGPTVENPSIAAVEDTTATLGGEVTDTGGNPVTERGIYWSTTQGFVPPGQGTKVSETGSWGVGGFTVAVDTLPAGTVVYFKAFAVNSVGPEFSAEVSFQTEPTLQASNPQLTAVGSRRMNITWTAGDGDGTLVVLKQDSAITANPVDGTAYTATANFGSGTDLGGGSYVVYSGVDTQVQVMRLRSDTDYYVKIFEYAGSGPGLSGVNYQQDAPVESNDRTLTEPAGHNDSRDPVIQCDQCHALHDTPLPRDAAQESTCTYCHNATDMGVGNTHLWDISMHVVNGGTTTIDCGSCHVVHAYDSYTDGSAHGRSIEPNIARIRWDTAKFVPGALEPAIFQRRPEHLAFAPSGPFDGICQSCHQNTSNHTQDGWDDDDNKAANNNHGIGGNCITCHLHSDGFLPVGCTDCHNTTQDAGDGGPTRREVVSEFSTPNLSHHVDGANMTDNDCTVCHYEGVDSAFHQNNEVDLRDPDTGGRIALPSTGDGFAKFTRDRTTDVLEEWVTTVQNDFCMKCHDNDGAQSSYNADDGGTQLRPFSTTTADVPIVFELFDPTNPMHHAVRGPGANNYTLPTTDNGNNITMELPWNQDGTHDLITCFDCHGDIVTDPDGTSNLISAHGGGNQRMLRNAIDFDTMEATTDKANLPDGMGLTVETFCTNCHKSSVYVSGSSGTVGSRFDYHGVPGNGSHAGSENNDLGCMACHGGVVNLSDTLVDNGAVRGNLHGSAFVWPAGSFSSGTTAKHFILGGYINGWWLSTSQGAEIGECSGGQCNHTGSSTRNGQDYPRVYDGT